MDVRVATWNCADHFPRKAEMAVELDADLLILQEVKKQHAHALGPDYNWHWFGEAGQRGLLVATKSEHSISFEYESGYRHAVALSASLFGYKVSVGGIWTMPFRGNYVKATCHGLDEILPRLAGERVIVAGDFNASSVFDKGPRSRFNFHTISDRLHANELKSAWHQAWNEKFGEESKPTYYHQWRQDQPVHIDYIFASPALLQSLKRIEIGGLDSWPEKLSDHMPIVAEFELDERS